MAAAVTPETTATPCLEAAASRATVYVGQPVFLLVSLVNCSDSPTKVRDLLDASYGLLQIEIAGPTGESWQPYRPAIRREGRGAPTITLESGERLTVEVPVFFGSGGWVLRSPGTYRLRAEYPVGNVYVRAEAVELTIADADTAADREAAERMMSDPVALFLFMADSASLGSGADGARSIVSDYPKSPWAEDAGWVLRAADATHDTTAVIDLSATDKIRSTSDPVLVAQAVAAISTGLSEHGREVEAREMVEALEARVDTNQLPTDLQKVLRGEQK